MNDNEIAARLAKFERSLRRWKIGAFCLAVAVVAGAAHQEPVSESLKTRRLAIVDDKGVQRIVLEAPQGGGAAVSIFDPSSKVVAGFGMLPQGKTFLALYSHEGKKLVARGSLTFDEGSGAQLIISDGNGRPVSLIPAGRQK